MPSRTIRAALAAMNQIRTEDELALQIVLGQAICPAPLPPNLPDPHASWLDVALGNVGLASPENRLARLLFKLAVELSMTMHVLAAQSDVDEETLHRLRGYCVDEVKRLSGKISFDKAWEHQKE